MINFDMIGRTNGKLSIMGVGTGKEFVELLNSVDYDTNNLQNKTNNACIFGFRPRKFY